MALSPMMQQYMQIKEENPDCLLMFRLGDFYELFFDDAKTVSAELDLVLTKRDCGDGERAPMCGVPFHSVDGYITKLISRGFRVAICEQLEDPSKTKGLVKRGVVRVISSGTVTEGGFLKEGQNNFLVSVSVGETGYGFAYADVSTGDVFATELIGDDKDNLLRTEAYAVAPSEAVLPGDSPDAVKTFFAKRIGVPVTMAAGVDARSEDFLAKSNASDKSCLTTELAQKAAALLIAYIKHTQKTDIGYIKAINYYKTDAFMRLDTFTRRNLELTEAMRSGEKKGSLLWVLDKTGTSMGARLLKQWLDRPLLRERAINARLDAVQELKENPTDLKEIAALLKQMVDMERISTRLVYGTSNARDLKALESTVASIAPVKAKLAQFSCKALCGLHSALDTLEDVGTSIAQTVIDEPPITLREGGIIKPGANKDVDELRLLMSDSTNLLANIEAREKENTGIRTLKVGYNRVFGYYIEVSNSFKDAVPDYYIRRQTLTNGERYITPELKELEGKVLGARAKDYALEYELFSALRRYIIDRIARIQQSCGVLAELDVYCSLATVALQNSFVRPEVDVGGVIDIKDGRHPVVEKFMGDSYFVPNDCLLDTESNRLALITGPNMAGKSTFMRQVALMTVMAQIGSFVPARNARIGIVDRLFTRVGASDDLATGTSTFMLEMTELAHILKNATKRSLIIYDEIGRGTSTYDGMSIARAVLEYTAGKLGAKTLFATHYHELTELEGAVGGVVNYHIAAKKRGEDIVFLRKIVRGATDDSYGIEVAKLAGVPDEVVGKARRILKSLEDSAAPQHLKKEPTVDNNISFTNLAEAEVAERLRVLDINTLTPIEALGILYELKKKVD